MRDAVDGAGQVILQHLLCTRIERRYELLGIARNHDEPEVDNRAHQSELLALDAASGRRLWKHLAAGPVYSSPALVERGGDRQAIYAALDNRLTGVDAGDGVLRWSLDIGAPIWDGVPQGESLWASPVAARINGRWMLYLGSPAGAFLAIPLDQAELASTSPPWSNRRFWIIMVLVLAGTTMAATWLARRQRLR